ncbi:hypothetical protein E2C01_036429 [Portunus trituberculatus]|uniref:Uncharacterized protein n=1 Tax=Portunus trituberculatus TaxID=210409 RepID=A0A5B7FCF8_PORTR|nr:hypothetical protein [Portunus trituberculatus]
MIDLYEAVVQWNHARFGVREVSKRTGSNPVHGPSVVRVMARRPSSHAPTKPLLPRLLQQSHPSPITPPLPPKHFDTFLTNHTPMITPPIHHYLSLLPPLDKLSLPLLTYSPYSSP